MLGCKWFIELYITWHRLRAKDDDRERWCRLEHSHTMEFIVTLLLHILPFPSYFLSHLENVTDESYDTQRKLASNHIEIEGLYVYALCLATLPSSENYYFLVNPAETITVDHFAVTTKWLLFLFFFFSFLFFFAFTDSLEIHCTLLNRNDPVPIHPDADRAPDLLMLVSSFTPNSKVSEVVSWVSSGQANLSFSTRYHYKQRM